MPYLWGFWCHTCERKELEQVVRNQVTRSLMPKGEISTWGEAVGG